MPYGAGEIFMKHKRIAVFGNGWSNEFYHSVLEGLREEARKDHVDVFAFVMYTLWDKSPQDMNQLNLLDIADPAEFDGAILLVNTMNIPEEYERVVGRFKEAGVPMVAVEGKIPGVPSITSENYKGMHDLVEHLVKKHNTRKIIYMRGIEGNVEDAVRQQAVREACDEYGAEVVDVLDGDFGYWRSYLEVNKFIANGHELPDAFVCANDHTAIGVMTALYENGIEVPDQVKVTGFDCIIEGKVTFPLLATISRGWDKMGIRAYEELKNQIREPNPDYAVVYESSFVPSESCGCEARQKDADARMVSIRSTYSRNIQRSTCDSFFQDMYLAASHTGSKEEFPDKMGSILSNYELLGNDFWLCTEPELFELEDKVYTHCIKGYSELMDALFWKKDGKGQSSFRFEKKTMVPGYSKKEDSSDFYIFAPINYQDFLIGYVVIKNDNASLYSQDLRRWVTYVNNVFMALRQNIFTQKTNRKLQEIYMTDFLTGLYNRTGVEDIIFGHIEKQKKKGQSTILIFADIDRMKMINDNYGHLEGDVAIRATSSALIASCPKGFIMGRYGGDEFVAVGDYDNVETAEEFCLRLTESIRNYIELLHLRFPLSVSVGGQVIVPDSGGAIADYIEAADKSMYERKEEAHRRLDARFKNEPKL